MPNFDIILLRIYLTDFCKLKTSRMVVTWTFSSRKQNFDTGLDCLATVIVLTLSALKEKKSLSVHCPTKKCLETSKSSVLNLFLSWITNLLHLWDFKCSFMQSSGLQNLYFTLFDFFFNFFSQKGTFFGLLSFSQCLSDLFFRLKSHVVDYLPSRWGSSQSNSTLNVNYCNFSRISR